jgi:hypothetical protein
MSKPQYKKQVQMKLARLEIVGKLYKRGYSVRGIREEVLKRLALDTYALSTCHKDIQTLLEEWREIRLDDMDMALQLELERIDDTVRELWSQWEKSKEDYVRQVQSRKGRPKCNQETGEETIKTYNVENTTTNIVGLGNPSYISEIRQQLAERRKLLGLYAPDKREITGKDGRDLINEPVLIEIIDNRDKVDAKDTDN